MSNKNNVSWNATAPYRADDERNLAALHSSMTDNGSSAQNNDFPSSRRAPSPAGRVQSPMSVGIIYGAGPPYPVATPVTTLNYDNPPPYPIEEVSSSIGWSSRILHGQQRLPSYGQFPMPGEMTMTNQNDGRASLPHLGLSRNDIFIVY